MTDSQIPTDDSDSFRSRFNTFKEEWRSGAIPDVISYIMDSNSPAHSLSRLIEFDLQCRWKNFFANDGSEPCDEFGFPLLPTIDDYANSLPGGYQRLILTPELLAVEYRVRNCWGDKPGPEIFIERFPDDPDAVKNQLNGIDAAFEFERLGSTVRPSWYDELCEAFERAQEVGEGPIIETFLQRVDKDDRQLAILALIELEVGLRSRDAEPPEIEEYKKRFPKHQTEIEEAFARLAHEQTLIPTGQDHPCQAEEDQIRQIGPYRPRRLLGKGSFGLVFEASKPGEEELVAIKVLRKKWVDQPRQVEQFLSEARQTQNVRHAGVELTGPASNHK